MKDREEVENKVLHVRLSGGFVGLIATNPRFALEKAIREANDEGWHVVQVIDDTTGNLLVWLVRLLVLLVTLLIWTPANGYFVVVERELVEF